MAEAADAVRTRTLDKLRELGCTQNKLRMLEMKKNYSELGTAIDKAFDYFRINPKKEDLDRVLARYVFMDGSDLCLAVGQWVGTDWGEDPMYCETRANGDVADQVHLAIIDRGERPDPGYG